MPDADTASTEDDGVSPCRALVVPRGHRRGCTASLPIDQLLLAVVRSRTKGIVVIVGPPGGGKTTALRHLRAGFPADVTDRFFEAREIFEAQRAAATGWVVLAVTSPEAINGIVDFIQLSRWTLDDCLEYLHAKHRSQCASVLSRLGKDKSFSAMDGSPRLLSLVMDRMAADESQGSARDILREHIREVFPAGHALDRLIIDGPKFAPLDAEQWRWWHHQTVENICRADWIVARLLGGVVPIQLFSMDESAHLIGDIAAALLHQPEAVSHLVRHIESDRRSTANPMVASILAAFDPDWKPADARGLMLAKAQLACVRWAGIDLTGAFLMGTNLSGADLSDANLKAVNADGANLSGANLKGSRLDHARFVGANLKSADLSGITGIAADFSEADLTSANLQHADLREGQFAGACLEGVSASSADFTRASLAGAKLEGANFTGANFTSTGFTQIDFSETNLSGVCFANSSLIMCNFEWLEMPEADFTGANLYRSLLTGTRIACGKFVGANLSRTGLAEIDWEDADLRNANLTGASFHMGSTRSGLVGSTIAGEGSRTGFYTDEFKDQKYKPPEEIRKACLVGANLLGAVVEHTDFYLVDLRKAIYSASQAEHFVKSGAILEGPEA